MCSQWYCQNDMFVLKIIRNCVLLILNGTVPFSTCISATFKSFHKNSYFLKFHKKIKNSITILNFFFFRNFDFNTNLKLLNFDICSIQTWSKWFRCGDNPPCIPSIVSSISAAETVKFTTELIQNSTVKYIFLVFAFLKTCCYNV